MLFNIHSLEWDKELCDFFEIPMDILPNIWSSSEIYGRMKTEALEGVPISGYLRGPVCISRTNVLPGRTSQKHIWDRLLLTI